MTLSFGFAFSYFLTLQLSSLSSFLSPCCSSSFLLSIKLLLQLPVGLTELSLSVFAELIIPLFLLKYILKVLSLVDTPGRIPLRL